MIWAIRLARLLVVLFVVLIICYYFLNFLEPLNLYFDVKPPLKWMDENPNLSGWAQFFGATAAILLAIAIPAWQRHGQNLDRWRDAQECNASLALLSFYLLGEVRSYLSGFFWDDSTPRQFIRKDFEAADLLQRIHSLEIRENSQDRITRLFRARASIHQTTSSVSLPFVQSNPLSENEKVLLRERIALLDELIEAAEKENGRAIHARNRANLWFPARAIFPIIMFIIYGRQYS